jgi:hypothetical protein
VELDAVAVELDPCSLRSPLGTFSTDLASAGSMKPGKDALAPMAGGFLR